jgi:hypothetical protein
VERSKEAENKGGGHPSENFVVEGGCTKREGGVEWSEAGIRERAGGGRRGSKGKLPH